MTWRQFVRAIEVSQRRATREAQQRQRAYLRQAAQNARQSARETAKRQKQWEKEQKWLQASNEAAQFEHYVEELLSLHTEWGEDWDWPAVASCPPPPEPQRDLSGQQAAEAAIAAYQPGFIERAIGAAKTHRTTLELALANAVATEAARYQAACAQYQEDRRNWEVNVRLAPGVLRLEHVACAAALAHAHSFADVERFGSAVSLAAVGKDVATISILIANDEVIPREEIKLTSSGKLSTKAMSESRYWSLFQGHVCSCALRVALEAFAVLPVRRSIVNVARRMLDPSTGHLVELTVLAVHIAREDIDRLNLDAIEPVAAMKNFPHRMHFKKTTGFTEVEPITADEQWVTS